MSTYTDDQAALFRQQIVPKADARLLALETVPKTYARELTLHWTCVDDRQQAAACLWLEDYPDGDNPNKASFVRDPVASNETYAGKWRLAFTRRSLKGEPPGIVMVLREGLIQSYADLLASNAILVQTEDRLINPHGKLWNALDQTVEYKYTGLEQATAIAVKDAFRTANPTVLAVQNVLMDDGTTELHLVTLARTWVTATNASAAEQNEQHDHSAVASDPAKTVERTWNHITQASVPVLLAGPVAAWQTGTAYQAGQFVTTGGLHYRSATAHTAAALFATDLTAGRWIEYAIVKTSGQDNLDGSGQAAVTLLRVWTFATLADADNYWRTDERTNTPAVPGATLTRRLEHVAEAGAPAFVALLDAQATLTNPKANGVERVGTFANSVTVEKGEAVGTVTILNRLVAITAPTSKTDLQACPALYTRDKRVLQALSLYTGTGEAAGVIWENLAPTTAVRTVCLDTITDAEMVTIAAAITGCSAGIKYLDRKWKIAKDGTAILAVAFDLASWAKTWTADKSLASESNKNGLDRRRSLMVDGVATPATPAALTALIEAIAAEDGYALGGARASLLEDRVALASEQIKTNDATSGKLIEEYRAGFAKGTEQQGLRWVNVTGTVADTIIANAKTNEKDMTGATPAAPTGHVLSHTRKIHHQGDELFDVIRVTFRPFRDIATHPTVERYAILKGGSDIEYRPTPTDGTHAQHQYRMHYYLIERLYTNSVVSAWIWAVHNNGDGSVYVPGEPNTHDTEWLATAGRTGKSTLVWGNMKERENASTLFVSYRCTVDFRTEWATNTTSGTNGRLGPAFPVDEP